MADSNWNCVSLMIIVSMFVEERRWCEWFKKVLVSNYFPMIASFYIKVIFCVPAGVKKHFSMKLSCQIKWIYWTFVTVFKLHPNCFHMHKKLCSQIIAPHRLLKAICLMFIILWDLRKLLRKCKQHADKCVLSNFMHGNDFFWESLGGKKCSYGKLLNVDHQCSIKFINTLQ
jgi:hypothetical protein